MTRLSTLRAQLASLRRARLTVRQAAAWSAVAIAALWSLAILFALDVRFEFGRVERAILLVAAIGLVVWAARRFALPYLGVRETEEDMALLVERRQQIDSDLIAALQFESPQAGTWGSPQLEGAVIDYVAQVGRGINVFDGFSTTDLWRRGGLLAGTLLVALIATALFPGHVWAFAQRLLLGRTHYPTDTLIEQIVVNQREVLNRASHGGQPLDARCAQGRPIQFLVECRGALPEKGSARLTATGGSRSRTELTVSRLSLDDRQARLTQAAQKMKAAAADDSIDISQPWRDEVISLVKFDAPQTAAALALLKERSELSAALERLNAALAIWPADASTRGIYVGVLDRLVDGVEYKLTLGDAWTDPARVTMIPLPIVQRSLTPTPPMYAKTTENSQSVTTPQMAVLEGTRIDVAVECVNDKPLASAWMNVRQGNETQRLELVKADETGLRWRLDDPVAGKLRVPSKGNGTRSVPTTYSPLARVTKELSYEIQVLDADGLSLESPLRGTIHIKPDRAPTGGAELVHKVVLPEAQPVIEYRASDDFGVARVRLAVAIERQQGDIVPTMPPGESASHTGPMVESTGSQMESATLDLYAADAAGKKLEPKLTGKYALALGKLPLAQKLVKGDRVKLTLEVTDFRGDAGGASYFSDPLVLEISDESGVLAAISEADERSEQRLTDIIKRQLGIGESP
ncbi:MAG TPA: hypothetical protein VFB80_21040 [Pirellulaceae bacterium]|nr:hypothetical protein [Pirellulaceae bacterium]